MNNNSINALISAGRLAEAEAKSTQLIAENPCDASLYLQRGKVRWSLGRRADAITDYEHAVALDPDSPARLALQMSRDIMNFYNKDLYNP